jgi:hypothetical protein
MPGAPRAVELADRAQELEALNGRLQQLHEDVQEKHVRLEEANEELGGAARKTLTLYDANERLGRNQVRSASDPAAKALTMEAPSQI